MNAQEIYPLIRMCVCGSKKFRPMIGYLINTFEIICAECTRPAEFNNVIEIRKGER